MTKSLHIDCQKEKEKIISFLQDVFKKTGIEKVVLGVSGGIDSATSLYLLKEVLPIENIFINHLYYFPTSVDSFRESIQDLNFSESNIKVRSIQEVVDPLLKYSDLDASANSSEDKIRIGNIMARIRMITLFDEAKNNNALVCGTENRSENYLGYFTRFGDAASDIEPISHLFKTQVYQLANYLKISQKTIQQAPTAGLWEGQTDEKELGFSYEDADQVMHLYFDKKIDLEQIEKDFPEAKKIIQRVKANEFKHKVPYLVSA